jgi:SAM-dependent methyltransferase
MKLLRTIQQIPDKIGQHYLKKRIGKTWVHSQGDKFSQRQYKDYVDYIGHQQAKLKFKRIHPIDLVDYDQKYRAVLAERLRKSGLLRGGESVLCLGARLGSEVKAFLDLGCFAVGIDLNPGEANPYVLPGDFHHIQFAEGSIDITFTNSLDHVYDIKKFIDELSRVLKPGGIFIIEVSKGKKEGGSAGFYESFHWDSINDVVSILHHHGFIALLRQAIDFPFPGEQVFLKVGKEKIPDIA